MQARLLVVVGLAGAFVGRGGRAARAAGDGHAEDLEACRGVLLLLLQALLEASPGLVREGHVHRRAVADEQSLWLDLGRGTRVWFVST